MSVEAINTRAQRSIFGRAAWLLVPAAPFLIVLVIWVYYAAQILFLGAEFTQVYARHRGSRIVPSDNAVPVEVVKKTEPGEEPAPRSTPGRARHA